MCDVPLQDAVIAVNLATKARPPEVRVLRCYDPAILRYEFTAGAGEERWDNHPDHRPGFLYETIWFLAHSYGIQTDVIDTAMQVIPEYRDPEGNDLRPTRAD
jgi:hypothetical protein